MYLVYCLGVFRMLIFSHVHVHKLIELNLKHHISNIKHQPTKEKRKEDCHENRI